MEEIICEQIDDKVLVICLENGKIVEFYEFDTQNMPISGNIYIGQITDVLPKTNTIFVDIGLEKFAFLQLDSLEKKYKKGDKIAVKVKRNASKTKGAMLTNKFSKQEKEIVEKAQKDDSTGLIYDVSSPEKFVYLNLFSEKTTKVYINNLKIYFGFLKLLGTGPQKGGLDVQYKEVDFLDEFGLKTEFSKIFDRKVWLKSGGYIVIDKTEALTAIDVNSAKSTKSSKNIEEMALKTNEEAAIEAMKQIRLRNMGGIIVIDFINQVEESSKKAILGILKSEKLKDRSTVEIAGFTKLGLVEITRKKL